MKKFIASLLAVLIGCGKSDKEELVGMAAEMA
jgi:hypothetical protein